MLKRETLHEVICQVSPQAVVELCSKLVGIPSTSGREEKIAHFLSDLLKSLGYDIVTTDDMGMSLEGKCLIPGKRLLLSLKWITSMFETP